MAVSEKRDRQTNAKIVHPQTLPNASCSIIILRILALYLAYASRLFATGTNGVPARSTCARNSGASDNFVGGAVPRLKKKSSVNTASVLKKSRDALRADAGPAPISGARMNWLREKRRWTDEECTMK